MCCIKGKRLQRHTVRKIYIHLKRMVLENEHFAANLGNTAKRLSEYVLLYISQWMSIVIPVCKPCHVTKIENLYITVYGSFFCKIAKVEYSDCIIIIH